MATGATLHGAEVEYGTIYRGPQFSLNSRVRALTARQAGWGNAESVQHVQAILVRRLNAGKAVPGRERARPLGESGASNSVAGFDLQIWSSNSRRGGGTALKLTNFRIPGRYALVAGTKGLAVVRESYRPLSKVAAVERGRSRNRDRRENKKLVSTQAGAKKRGMPCQKHI